MTFPIAVPKSIPREVSIRLVESAACAKLIEYLKPRGVEPVVARHIVLWMWAEGFEFQPVEKTGIIRP